MPPAALPHHLVGDGPRRVVAVHGWFADRRAFAPVEADLDGGGFSYALVDLPGYGEAREASGPFTTAAAAEGVLATADALGWERFAVLGHSMGGAVAQRVAAAAPERLTAMAGVSPVPASGMAMPDGQWELFASAAGSAEARRAIVDATTGGCRPGTWLDRTVRQSLERSDAGAFRAWLDSWAGEDFHREVAGCPVPALAVVGALDPAVGAELMRGTWLAWYPNARLVELASAGHYAMDETPLELVRTVEDFLREAVPAAGAAG